MVWLRSSNLAIPRAKGTLARVSMKSPRLLDLNEVLQHPGKKIDVSIESDLEGDPDVELLAPVKGTLNAVSTGNLLLLRGRFESRLIVDCARCGAPLEVGVDFEVEEQFPVEGVAACYGMNDFARVVPDEPYPLFEGNSLLVDALLRQDLIVAEPLQPLCQYGWEGPCPNAALGKPAAAAGFGRPEWASLSKWKTEGGTASEDEPR